MLYIVFNVNAKIYKWYIITLLDVLNLHYDFIYVVQIFKYHLPIFYERITIWHTRLIIKLAVIINWWGIIQYLRAQ